MDIANTPPEFKDFFGMQTPNPAVTSIRCPLLAFFGTHDDVGTAADLELLKSSIHRQSTGPSRVDTAMVDHADHMYQGEEAGSSNYREMGRQPLTTAMTSSPSCVQIFAGDHRLRCLAR